MKRKIIAIELEVLDWGVLATFSRANGRYKNGKAKSFTCRQYGYTPHCLTPVRLMRVRHAQDEMIRRIPKYNNP